MKKQLLLCTLIGFGLLSTSALADTYNGTWKIGNHGGKISFSAGELVPGKVSFKVTKYTGDKHGFKGPRVTTGTVSKNGKKLTVYIVKKHKLTATIKNGRIVGTGRYCGKQCGTMTVR